MSGISSEVVWITGASTGIGRELAIKLAAQGNTVLASARGQQDLLELVFAGFAERAASSADKRLILERVRAKRPAPPEVRTAWKDFSLQG